MSKLIVKKKVENGVLYEGDYKTGVTVRVDKVRISHPHVGKPWAKNANEVKKFSAVGILNKETHAEIIDLIKRVQDKMISENDIRVKPINRAMKDGDGDSNDKPEYEGAWYLSAREENQPTAKSAMGGKLVNLTPEQAEREIYGGCYGSILVRFWPQDNDWGQRINAGLVGVVKTGDGESFGNSRIDDSDAYGDLGDDEGGFDDLDDDDDL